MGDAAIAEFVSAVRRRRIETGQPEYITDERLYRLLDGLLAANVNPDRQAVEELDADDSP